MYHTDGAVMEAVEDLIDMGIDILEALQFDAAGMDPVALKRRFGERLCFHGGISVQTTLPFHSAGAVTQEVLERIRVLGDGGGYILAPSHAIPVSYTHLASTSSKRYTRPGHTMRIGGLLASITRACTGEVWVRSTTLSSM